MLWPSKILDLARPKNLNCVLEGPIFASYKSKKHSKGSVCQFWRKKHSGKTASVHVSKLETGSAPDNEKSLTPANATEATSAV